MNQRQLSIAKITRPRTTGAYDRKRLFEVLDQHCDKPVIWISGPAGAGKTTLVSSYLDSRKLSSLWYQVDAGDADVATFFYYLGLAGQKASPRRTKRPLPLLTPEYQFGIPVFTRRYFEDLFGRLRPPAAVVFDNYQEAGEGAALAMILQNGLAAIPEGILVIVISRRDPPPELTSLRANGRMEIIGWNELRLDEEEARGMLKLRGSGGLSDEVVRRIYALTEGWAAGLVLMTQRTRSTGDGPEDPTREGVFQYFAEEIFQRADRSVKEFLLQTAFLPTLSIESAERLTGLPQADEVLTDLVRRNFFTVCRPGSSPTYEYHPLFREFLTSRARRSHSPSQFQAFQRHAAALLHQSGQVEDAALLFMQGEGWEELASLALSNAQHFISQGRSHTVEEWLNAIPASFRERNAWLIYWQGICKITVDLQTSRNLLEQAFELFKTRNDAAGLYLSWCGVVDTFVYEWGGFLPLDRWIAEIEDILKKHPAFPSPVIEARVTYAIFCALMYRQPQHPDIDHWAERAMSIVLTSDDVPLKAFISSNLIMYYSWWRGDMAKSAMLVNALQERVRSKDISPLLRIIWNASAAADALLNADLAQCMSLAESGLQLAEDTGMHIWDFMLFTTCTWAALTMGDLATADRYLRKMSFAMHSGHKGNIFVYHWQMGWKFMWEGRFSTALDHEREGLKVVREGGFTMGCATLLQGSAEALIERGDFTSSKTHLDEAHTIGLGAKSLTFEYQNAWLTALYYVRQRERSKALPPLRRLLEISREKGIYSHVQWRTSVMTELFTLALEEDIEVAQVQKLIRLHQMVPGESHLHLDNWPWPVKVYTLGQFRLELDGKPVLFGGKTPKKPLELLKAIIALGGREVSEEKVIDELWPEAAGDLASKSFEMALQRLRKLLGNDKAVRRQDGKLTLDPRYFWTDLWAFEQLVLNAEQDSRDENGALPQGRSKTPSTAGQLEKALGLYKGHFLPSDMREPWLTSTRERLRSKFLRLVTKAGELHEDAGQWKQAINCFERGLERDAVCEEFYQHLMACHQKLGHRSEAVKTYHRCRAALRDGLGLEPSSRTEEIYASVRGGNISV